MKILAAPAGYVLDSSGIGSEYYWPFRLMVELSQAYSVSYIALASKARLDIPLPNEKIRIIELFNKPRADLLNKAVFYLRLYNIGCKLASRYSFTLLEK